METVIRALAAVAVLSNAIIYGTDAFSALVQRPALAQVDDATLTSVMGQIHRFGDQRLPVPGVVGLVTALLAAVAAGIDGRATSAVAAGVSALVLVIWLVIYGRVSAPVNKELTAAAKEGRVAADARGLQRTWDSVINARVLLQAIALIGLCVALVAS